MLTIQYQDLGMIPYKEAWDLQEEIFGEMMKTKLGNARLDEANNDPFKEPDIILRTSPCFYTW